MFWDCFSMRLAKKLRCNPDFDDTVKKLDVGFTRSVLEYTLVSVVPTQEYSQLLDYLLVR